MFSHHARFRFHSRLVVSLVLILTIAFGAVAQVRRRIQVSKMINPSEVAGSYFSHDFKFGGGVVPRGAAEFVSPANTELSAQQLEFVILDQAKLGDDQTDYDAIGLRWQGETYKLAVPDDFVYPLMKFIQRNSYIVYTIPVTGSDKTYFDRNGLIPFKRVRLGEDVYMAYAALEFNSARQKEFLHRVDFAKTYQLSDATKGPIIDDIQRRVRGSNQPASALGTYVNADFHVKYHFYLTTTDGQNVVDSDGLPLRYAFFVATDGTAIIDDIEVFAFPKTPYDFQDQAILFFQTTAILRQFHKDNPRAFNRFLAQVAAVRRNR